MSGSQYSYEIQLTPDQETVPVAHIEIVDDVSVEENETFVLSLTPEPYAFVEIPANVSIATVLIIDNDGKIFDSLHENLTYKHEITSMYCNHTRSTQSTRSASRGYLNRPKIMIGCVLTVKLKFPLNTMERVQ